MSKKGVTGHVDFAKIDEATRGFTNCCSIAAAYRRRPRRGSLPTGIPSSRARRPPKRATCWCGES